MRRVLLMIMMLCIGTLTLSAQTRIEQRDRQYSVQIDFGRAYISGLCLMSSEGEITTSSIVNEFGVSALTYRYDAERDKIKILAILKQMNRPIVKAVLRRDLRKITVTLLRQPSDEMLKYEDAKYNVRYVFTPILEQKTE